MPNRQLYPSFHFRVKFMIAAGALQKLGLNILASPEGNDDIDVHFKSVSGLEMNLQTESINEGGLHHHNHKVPVRTETADIVLKRGYVKNSTLIEWCKFNFNNPLGIVFPVPVFIELLDTQHLPTVIWNLNNAYPVKWSFGELNAENSGLLIETLTLHCNYFTVNNV